MFYTMHNFWKIIDQNTVLIAAVFNYDSVNSKQISKARNQSELNRRKNIEEKIE